MSERVEAELRHGRQRTWRYYSRRPHSHSIAIKCLVSERTFKQIRAGLKSCPFITPDFEYGVPP